MVDMPPKTSPERKRTIVLPKLWAIFRLVYGLFQCAVFLLLAVTIKIRFYLMSKQEKIDFREARHRLWDLDKKPFGLTHDFCRLKDGTQLHYVYDLPSGGVDESTGLVIFIHGFPDTWYLWRPFLVNNRFTARATMIAVDLPSYGGSDSVKKSDANTLLNALTEFILAMRKKYLAEDSKGRVVVVAHDWGGVIGFRMADEAPQLADRFILSNTVHPALSGANTVDRFKTAGQMCRTWLRRPTEYRLLQKALITVLPVLNQLRKSGYVFVFNLPKPIISWLGARGDFAFMRYLNAVSTHANPSRPLPGTLGAEHLASSTGPGRSQCGPAQVYNSGNTKTISYGPSVKERAAYAGWFDKMAIYRDGILQQPWEKSIENLWELNELEQREGRRRSSPSYLLGMAPDHALKAPVTVIWGAGDVAIDKRIALQSMGDYFSAKPSHVIMMEGVGHWTPCAKEGVAIFEEAIEWSLKGEQGSLKTRLGDKYPFATVQVEK